MLLLRKVAEVLGCSLHDLFDAAVRNTRELSPIQISILFLLEGLDDARRQQTVELLTARFGMASAARHADIALIGRRGAAKSAIGAQLAENLGVAFIELDGEIDRELGVELADIFSPYGQDTCRDRGQHLRAIANELFHGLAACGARRSHDPRHRPAQT